VNPADWEGDMRLYESLASGALVFVDQLHVPYPEEASHLIDGHHIIYYDNQDRMAFKEKLRYYLHHPEEGAVIAQRGWELAAQYHRAVNRVDYMVDRSLRSRQRQQCRGPPPPPPSPNYDGE